MKLLRFLKSIHPEFWIMIYPYSESWDAALNRLLDSYTFDNITKHTTTLGDVTVWIANMPYAAFTPLINGLSNSVRPSRTTIVRAREALRLARGNEVGEVGEFDHIGRN